MTEKRKKENTEFRSLPPEIVGEITLHWSSPSELFSLMMTNKHFSDIIRSKNFFGSKNIKFYIGLKLNLLGQFEHDIFQDELMFRLCAGLTPMLGRNKSNSEKKRFGMRETVMDMCVDGIFPKYHPYYYVRNIELVDSAVYLDDSKLFELLQLFPRCISLDLNHCIFITHSFFRENKLLGGIQKLNILGCEGINEREIFSHPNLSSSLIALHSDGKFLSSNKNMKNKENNVKKSFDFPNLKKLHLVGTSIDMSTFHQCLVAPKLQTLVLIDVRFNNQQPSNQEGRKFFLEYYTHSLRVLKIINPYGDFIPRITQNLSLLEVLEIPVRSDHFFTGLRNIKKLKLRGGGLYSHHEIPALQVFSWFRNSSSVCLDLTEFKGFHLYEYLPNKEKFTEESFQFLTGFKVLRMCCDKTNFAEFLRKYGNENLKDFRCNCMQDITKGMLKNPNVSEKTRKRYEEKKILHFFCDECGKGCGNSNCRGKPTYCCKVGMRKCDECGMKSCCCRNCERCGKYFCCVSMTHGMPICSDICGYECLCKYCNNRTKSCERCEMTVCPKCSSVCIECDKRLCTSECIDDYNFVKDDDIPQNERVCKKCKKQREKRRRRR